MKKQNTRIDNKFCRSGFTLVELIVILVILAILAAIMIPSLIGWINKTKHRQVLLEARSCVQAAQSVGYESFGKGKDMPKEFNDEMTALAQNPTGSSVSDLTYNSTTAPPVTKLVYTAANGLKVTYLDGVYSFEDESGGGGNAFGQEATMNSIQATIEKLNLSSVDSAATENPSSNAKKLVEALAATDLKINLGDMGAATWKLAYSAGSSTNLYNQKLYWTTIDVNALTDPKPATVPVMCYNFKTKTYTVWNMSLKQGTGASAGSVVLNSESGKVLNSDQSYEGMMAKYNELTVN